MYKTIKENKVSNTDTSSFQEGEELYIDPEVPGGLTAKKPVDGVCAWDEETKTLEAHHGNS